MPAAHEVEAAGRVLPARGRHRAHPALCPPCTVPTCTAAAFSLPCKPSTSPAGLLHGLEGGPGQNSALALDREGQGVGAGR